MRKTARPVVWEGAEAQSSAPDPIQCAEQQQVQEQEGIAPTEAFLLLIMLLFLLWSPWFVIYPADS